MARPLLVAGLVLRLAPRIARLAAVAGAQWVALGIGRRRALRGFVRGALEAGMPEAAAHELARSYPDLAAYFGRSRLSPRGPASEGERR